MAGACFCRNIDLALLFEGLRALCALYSCDFDNDVVSVFECIVSLGMSEAPSELNKMLWPESSFWNEPSSWFLVWIDARVRRPLWVFGVITWLLCAFAFNCCCSVLLTPVFSPTDSGVLLHSLSTNLRGSMRSEAFGRVCQECSPRQPKTPVLSTEPPPFSLEVSEASDLTSMTSERLA